MKRSLFVLVIVCTGILLLAGCGRRTTAFPTSSAGDIPRISVDDLWERMQAGEAILLVDVREAQFYELEHISGSISIPVGEIEARVAELSGDHLLVFY